MVLILDLDNMPFKTVKYWALRTVKWFKLRGFIILKSSDNHYHVVFDKSVFWIKNMRVVAWVWVESKNEGLGRWFAMQCIKESSTLRVSPKKEKPSPRIVFRYCKQDYEIKNFLKRRRLIKKLMRDENSGLCSYAKQKYWQSRQ